MSILIIKTDRNNKMHIHLVAKSSSTERNIKKKIYLKKSKVEKIQCKSIYLIERLSQGGSSEELIYWRANNPKNRERREGGWE